MINFPGIKKEHFYRKQEDSTSLQIQPYFINFHRLSAERDFEYPRHQHIEYELIFIEKGPYFCRINDTDMVLQEEEILVIKPGDYHQDHLRKGQFHYVLHFSLGYQEQSYGGHAMQSLPLFSDDIMPHQQLLPINPEMADNFFKNLIAELEKNDIATLYIQDSLMEQFFWKMVREIPQNLISPLFLHHAQKRLFETRLLRFLFSRIRTNISVDEMAKAMSVSKRTLTYQCDKYLGAPPAQLFTGLRLSKAAERIANGEETIQETSDFFGFANQYHFSRLFKKAFGVSPIKYRQIHLHGHPK